MKYAFLLLALLAVACADDDGATCRSYGFRPDTDAYANCMMTLDIERRKTSGPDWPQPDFSDPLN